jgi:hypothetical protein
MLKFKSANSEQTFAAQQTVDRRSITLSRTPLPHQPDEARLYNTCSDIRAC